MKKSLARMSFGIIFLFLLLTSHHINAQEKIASKAPNECINKGKWRKDKIDQGNQKAFIACTDWLIDEYDEKRSFTDMNRDQMLIELKARYSDMIPYFKSRKKGARPNFARTLQKELDKL